MIARKVTILMAATLFAWAATAARAEDEETASPFGGKAPYASFGGVYGIERNDSALGTGGVNGPDGITPTSAYGDLSDSGGYDIRVGYNNVVDMLAVEVQWQSLLSFSTDATDAFTGNNLPAVEARMLSLNGRFTPLDGRFQPYALVGLGWVNVQGDRETCPSTSSCGPNSPRIVPQLHLSSFGMRFGAGLAVYITERTGVAVEAAYVVPMSGVIGHGERFDFIPITASVFFRFK